MRSKDKGGQTKKKEEKDGRGQGIKKAKRNRGRRQEAFNKRLSVCCFGSVRNPLALIDS